MPRIPWIERKFAFDFPVRLRYELIERLRGTPARLEDRVADLAPALLTRKPDKGWTIQENAGHLLDLEDLHLGRLDDFENDAIDVLRPADMSNRRTNEANHNDRDIDAILAAFRKARTAFVQRIERWSPDGFDKPKRHPRLDQPMRLVDMMYFTAEHDDYHLARISELIAAFSL